ncbi:MAG: hypothetical protein WD065_18830 [Planctomycetaceae bacterium]
MSPNKYVPHVIILPEDDANYQLANGFRLHEAIAQGCIQVLPVAGGWPRVKSLLNDEHLAGLRNYHLRHLVLLVDFDGDKQRYGQIIQDFPSDLMPRLFVIGIWTEPEDLQRQQLGNNEAVGRQLARECRENRRELWNHELLAHNAAELDRMNGILRPILFPAN